MRMQFARITCIFRITYTQHIMPTFHFSRTKGFKSQGLWFAPEPSETNVREFHLVPVIETSVRGRETSNLTEKQRHQSPTGGFIYNTDAHPRLGTLNRPHIDVSLVVHTKRSQWRIQFCNSGFHRHLLRHGHGLCNSVTPMKKRREE